MLGFLSSVCREAKGREWMADHNDDRGLLNASPIPLYVQVADIIRYRIGRGVWAEGSMLPPIEVLMKEFSVSRVTVRQALQLLARSGLIKVQRGVGTLVLQAGTGPHPVKVETQSSFLASMHLCMMIFCFLCVAGVFCSMVRLRPIHSDETHDVKQ